MSREYAFRCPTSIRPLDGVPWKYEQKSFDEASSGALTIYVRNALLVSPVAVDPVVIGRNKRGRASGWSRGGLRNDGGREGVVRGGAECLHQRMVA